MQTLDWLARGSWVAMGLVAVAAIATRLIGLDHLPGINGDETYYGVHALEWIAGRDIALRSGSDLPLNAPFFGLVALLHLLFPPSLTLMRSATVIHSLATCGLAYVLFRDRGRSFAALFALLCAVLPVHLGYARLSWDPSAVPTVMVLALAAATRRRPLLTALAFALLLWVHPTTVFALPMLIAPFLAARIGRAAPSDAAPDPPVPPVPEEASPEPAQELLLLRRRRFLIYGAVVLLACATIGLSDHLPDSIQQALDPGRITHIVRRLTSPGEMTKFALLYADFVAGPSTYAYLTGAISAATIDVHRLGCIALLVMGMFAMARLWANRAQVEIAVLYGLLASLCLAYPLSGLKLLLPHTARYGMFLSVPTCFVLAAWLNALATSARAASAVRFASALLGAMLLLSFHTHVLQALERPAPARADTFRTGATDPKQLAYDALMRMRSAGRRTLVLTEDWWIYWTVRYLAHGVPDVSVTIPGMRPDYRFPSDFALRAMDAAGAELFAITWADRALDRKFATNARARADIFGFEPTPILHVHALGQPPR